MNNLIKNLLRKAKGISLSRQEKAEIRQRLLISMQGVEGVTRTVVMQRSIFDRFFKPVFASVLAACLVGSGVSFASENSLPGDLLYPIKVNVNEEVRAVLATSEQGKAEWEAKRAGRRLEEVEQLAAGGNLKEEQKQEVEKRFVAHTEKAKQKIAAMEAKADLKGAAEASGRLEGSLKAHKKILKRLKNVESVAAVVKAQTGIVGPAAAMTMRAGAVMDMKAASMGMKREGVRESGDNDDKFERTRKEYRDAQEEKVLLKARQELKMNVSAEDRDEDDEDDDEPEVTLPVQTEIRTEIKSDIKIGL